MVDSINVQKPNFVNLNALRFFAFFAVLLSHAYSYYAYHFPNKYMEILHRHFFINGNLGVNFFFVLSGFLISWLLFIEKEKSGKIDVKAFYLRRIFRIWPVYYLVVFIGFMMPLITDFHFMSQPYFHITTSIKQLPWYLFFLGNFDIIVNGASNFILSVLWSVSVEEQFYLVWPIVFMLLSKKHVRNFCFLVICISFIYRVKNNTSLVAYYSTLSAMSDLAIGSLAAYYCLYNKKFMEWITQLSRKKIVLIYVALMAYIPLHGFSHIFGELPFLVYHPFEPIFFSLLFALILLEQNFSVNSLFKFGRIKLFSEWGKISYGLYSYHAIMFPFVFILTDALFPQDSFVQYLVRIVFSLLLTIIFSKLSYKFFETPFLKIKQKYSRI